MQEQFLRESRSPGNQSMASIQIRIMTISGLIAIIAAVISLYFAVKANRRQRKIEETLMKISHPTNTPK